MVHQHLREPRAIGKQDHLRVKIQRIISLINVLMSDKKN